MKKILIAFALLVGLSGAAAQAQSLYFTKNGHINFYSSTPMENIEADNRKVTSMVNTSTGDIEFSVLVMAFQFEKALMQEHFNENYMESSKYPKATFKGKITNINKINITADGTYPAEVAGKLTIHGVTKDVTTKGTFTVKGDKIVANSIFYVTPADYNITIPKLVSDKVAKEIKITVNNTYEPFRK